MNIVLGGTGRVGSHVIKRLLEYKQPVKAVVRNKEKADILRKSGVETVVADYFDRDALSEAVKGGKNIFLITPENPESSDFIGEIKKLTASYRAAVISSGIEKIVGLSSFGAQHASGTGNLEASYILEHAFDGIEAEKVFIRAAYYYSNWMWYLDTVKDDGILPTFFAADLKIPMISPDDVGIFADDVMAGKIKTKQVYEIAGPESYSSDDIAGILGKVFNKDVKAAEIPRDTWAGLLEQNGFSRSGAENMVLMTNAVISGKTQAQYDITHTGISFQDYIRRELGRNYQ